MLKGSLDHYSPLLQLFLTLITVAVFFILTMFVGNILAYWIFDINILLDAEALNIHSPEANIPALKFYQSVYSVGMFVVPPFFVAYLLHGKMGEYLWLNTRISFSKYIVAALTIIFALPLINYLTEINSHLQLPESLSGIETWMRNSEEQAEAITEKFLVMKNFGDLLINIILIAVIPALGEELLFRGVIQQIFSKMANNAHLGIIITAFIFAALHMQFFGFLPRMAMGVMFGYMLIWTRSLWVPIIAHLVNNALAVIVGYFIDHGALPENIEEVGRDYNIWLSGVASLILVFPFVLYLYRTRNVNS